jgi:hypothetical protein
MTSVKRSNNNKTTTMKTKSILFLAAFVAVFVLASCGAGRKASCDAYGSLNQTEQSADLATR